MCWAQKPWRGVHMRSWSLWAWRITIIGVAYLGAALFVGLILGHVQSGGYDLRPVASHFVAEGMRVTAAATGALSIEDDRFRVHIYQDDAEGEVLIIAESEVPASAIGWSAINDWNRDTTLVKIYADAEGLVVFEAGLPAGISSSPRVVIELVQYLRILAGDFLRQNASAARPATEI
jgi:hypothetical protein